MDLSKMGDEIDLSGENFKDGKEQIHPSLINKVLKNTETLECIKPLKLPIICYIPESILTLVRSIEASMSRALEFGLFLSGKFDSNQKFIISSKFYVPKQVVSSAAIEFKEEPDKVQFNGVVHRHPNGCTNFSGTDDSYINSNFDFSLLYVNNTISRGIINLEMKDHLRIQLPLEIKILFPIINDISQFVSRIEEKQITMLSDQSDLMDFHLNNNLDEEDEEDDIEEEDDDIEEEDDDIEEEDDDIDEEDDGEDFENLSDRDNPSSMYLGRN